MIKTLKEACFIIFLLMFGIANTAWVFFPKLGEIVGIITACIGLGTIISAIGVNIINRIRGKNDV